MKIDFFQLRVQAVLTAFFTSMITGGLTWLAAWGKLPGLDIVTVSSELAGFIAAFVASIIAALAAAVITRVNALLAALQDMPARPVLEAIASRDDVKKVVPADPSLAKEIPSDKVKPQ